MFSFVHIAELFNIFVGLMLTVAILTFASGLASYFPRIGTWPSFRDDSIKTLEWGVVVLFVLVVILGVVQHFQKHPKITTAILAGVIIVYVSVFIVRTLSASSGDEKGGH